ncbi:MAG: hypothetical protein C0483_21600 [Pirellula sp.]|nr:hypothetical protein [Pirellula sp.]
MTSIDTYASTNPALLAIVLRSFVLGYFEKKKTAMPFPLILLPVPIVLTAEVAETFGSTNVTTGLIPWVTRYPKVTVGMRQRLEATTPFSKEAFLFGLKYGLFEVDASGGVTVNPKGLKKNPPPNGLAYITDALKLAKRFGAWVAGAGRPENVFVSLGAHR